MLLRVKDHSEPTATPACQTPAGQALRWYTHAYNQPLLYHLVVLSSPCIPRPLRFGLARLMATVFRRLMPREYAAVRRNMRQILPDADASAIERLAQALFRNFACTFSDLLSVNRQTTAAQQRYVHRVWGEERLKTALASGRGIIAATAHLGNWDLAGRLLASYGKIVHVLVAPEQQAAIQRLLRGARQPAGLRFVNNDAPGGFMQLLMALRRGEVVAFQADRATHHRSDGTAMFFGAPALFPSAPMTLAAAAQVPVLPCFCLMRSDYRYDIFVDEPLTVSRHGEAVALQHMARILECYIAMAPDQWFNFYDVWDNTHAS